ncbi:MAG: ROK family transcriptional regulator [Gammaproteobacteria bacterium]|nr:ROK family transcriptional regulator [Gammaproteobacteria bacterium]
MKLEINEKRVLNEFRHAELASKADVARRVELTHPAVTRIVDKLCAMGFLAQQDEKRRGPRGQPATIYGLSDQNAFVGIHVGRRRLSFVAMGISGEILAEHIEPFGFLQRERLSSGAQPALAAFLARTELNSHTVVGIGISTPFFWEGWKSILATGDTPDKGWDSDIVVQLFQFPDDIEVFVENDGSSAALAELTFGTGRYHNDFLYINIGTFVGGGLVMDGSLRTGTHGNSGAIGPFPIARRVGSREGEGRPFDSLIGRASLHTLQAHLREELDTGDWSLVELLESGQCAQKVNQWVEDCAVGLAQLCIGAWSIVDVDSIIVDSILPKALLQDIVDKTQRNIEQYAVEGIVPCELKLGELGSMAQPIGGACLPMLELLGPPVVKAAAV